jgi:hypothetical protein
MPNLTLSSSGFSAFSGAASDLFASFGDKAKAQEDFAEAKNYGLRSEDCTDARKRSSSKHALP